MLRDTAGSDVKAALIGPTSALEYAARFVQDVSRSWLSRYSLRIVSGTTLAMP